MKKTFAFLALIGVLVGGGWTARLARAAATTPTHIWALYQGDVDDPPMAFTALGQDTDTWSILFFDPATDEKPYRITDDTWDELSPLVSADGRYVAFLRGDLSDENARLEWFVLDRACLPACGARPLLPDGGMLRGLRWSPVGPQIIAEGAANDIWLIDVELASAEQLIGGGWHVSPAWSPDGAWIIMSSDQVTGAVESDDIQIMPVEGGDLINLTYSGDWIEETDPTFSPDGQWIAYTTYALFTDDPDPFYPSPFSLIVIDAACIDDAPDACLDSRRALNLTDQAVGEYVWSPDSRYIAYAEGDPLGLTDSSAVWVVEIATGDAWQLSTGPSDTHLAWMPDSSAIMFNRSGRGSLDVYWVPVDGSLEPDIMLKGFLASADVYWAPQH